MKKIEINITDEKSNSADLYLSILQEKVENLRHVFFSFLNNFPEPLNTIAIEHYQGRIDKASENQMLGEFAPLLLGEMLSINPDLVKEFSFPWILLYAHSLMLDDLLDKTSPVDKLEILVSHMLLDASINKYKLLSGGDEFVSESYAAFRSESIVGMLHEINWSTNVEKKPDTKTKLISGRKAALVKFCASTMMYFDKQRALTSKEIEGLDYLCSGIQLLDDATDIVEDHTEDRLNLLLWNAYSWIRENIFQKTEDFDNKPLGMNQLLVSLICSGGLINTWKMAAFDLENSIKLLSDQPNETTAFINQMISKCRKSILLIEQVLLNNPSLKGDLMKIIENGEIDTIINLDSRRIAEPWQLISDIIKFGPKASQ